MRNNIKKQSKRRFDFASDLLKRNFSGILRIKTPGSVHCRVVIRVSPYVTEWVKSTRVTDT